MCMRGRLRACAWGGHLTTMLSRFSPFAIVGSRDQTHVARLVLCSRLLLSGWDKTPTKTNLEREGSFSSHSFVVYQGGKSKSELQGKGWKKKPRRNAASWLVSLACSATFLVQARPTCPGLLPPTVLWAHLID